MFLKFKRKIFFFVKLHKCVFSLLQVDRAISEELRSTGAFDVMSLDTDEAEHSIEMQLPYVRN